MLDDLVAQRVVGLVAARVVLGSLLATLEADSGRPLPFWMGDTLSTPTVMYPFAWMAAMKVSGGIAPGEGSGCIGG